MNIENFKTELLSSKIWENIKTKYNIIFAAIGGSRSWNYNEDDESDINIILISDNSSKKKLINEQLDINFPEYFIWNNSNKKYKINWKSIKLNDFISGIGFPEDTFFVYLIDMPDKNILYLDNKYKQLPTFFKNNKSDLIKNQLTIWNKTFFKYYENDNCLRKNSLVVLYLLYKFTNNDFYNKYFLKIKEYYNITKLPIENNLNYLDSLIISKNEYNEILNMIKKDISNINFDSNILLNKLKEMK